MLNLAKDKSFSYAKRHFFLFTINRFSFAGLQYEVECFCGGAEPGEDRRAKRDGECDKACPGDKGKKCGGYLRMNVYQTGVYQLPSEDTEVSAASSRSGSGSGGVRIVFLLTVSGRAVREVRRLIKRIYRREHFILIHVDSRQDLMHRELR